MSAGTNDFDISAAWLRKAQGDMRAFSEALAARLEAALPGRVTVERRRDGFLSKSRHVASIAVAFDGSVLMLAFEGGHARARRAKVVRGITIGTEEIGVPEWLADVARATRVSGEAAGATHDVLRDFLLS